MLFARIKFTRIIPNLHYDQHVTELEHCSTEATNYRLTFLERKAAEATGGVNIFYSSNIRPGICV